MKYGTVDLDMFALLQPLFGDKAEVVSLTPKSFNGRIQSAVVKSAAEDLPGGADSVGGELPHYSAEFTHAPQVKFTRQP